MNDSLELNEGKYHCPFKDDDEGLENRDKIFSELIKNDEPFTLNDFLTNPEMTGNYFLKKNLLNLEIKDRLLLKVINELEPDLKNEKRKIISFESCIENDELDDINKRNSLNIYKSINRDIHIILHGKKNLEEKNCIFIDENDKNYEVSENFKNGEYDKKICNLKEKNKIFEFIGIKSLMISITNYMNELIDSYLSYFEKLDEKHPNPRIGDWGDEDEQEGDPTIFDKIYGEIYKDFVKKSNICSELEESFQFSLGSFKTKYQLHFTLSELFTDIFWDSIFHNKFLCKLFIDAYTSIDYEDSKRNLKIIRKVIFDTNIPLKRQIVELLGLKLIEGDEKNDLMTLIVDKKNKHHNEIIKAEKEKEKNEMNKNEEDEININSVKLNNSFEFINNDKNNLLKNKKEMIIDDNINIRCNIIKANDIGKFKQKKAKANSSFLNTENKNTNIIIPFESINDKNDNKEKKNNENNDDGVPDLSNKKIEEIINYINDGKIVDKSTKNKRKKKSRKNKRKKEEAEQNKVEIEDSLVLKFKEDLAEEFIHAGSITKIKPVISDNWLKDISTYY